MVPKYTPKVEIAVVYNYTQVTISHVTEHVQMDPKPSRSRHPDPQIHNPQTSNPNTPDIQIPTPPPPDPQTRYNQIHWSIPPHPLWWQLQLSIAHVEMVTLNISGVQKHHFQRSQTTDPQTRYIQIVYIHKYRSIPLLIEHIHST